MRHHTTPLRRSLQALQACAWVASVWPSVTNAQILPPPPTSPAPLVRLEYDAQGNPTRRLLAPGVANFSTGNGYDGLSRVTTSTDARGKTTHTAYDGRDHILQVTDPRGLVTQYPRTGLGDTLGLVSPDTGAASHTLDAAGNLRTRTDSRGVTTAYSYDALSRLTSVVYSQGGQTQSFIWTYDQTGPGFNHGIGRLTSTQFPGGSSSYSYDAQGRLVTKAQTVAAASSVTLGVGFGYDAAGRLTSLIYPSGRVLHIPHVGGQAVSLELAPQAGAAALPLMSGLQFEPSSAGVGGTGPLRSWNWELHGGALPHSRAFDMHGRMVRHPLGGAVRDITYDAADRITSFTHLDAATGQATPATQALNQVFGYDETGRLTSVTTASASWGYAYDDNGNRTQMSLQSGATASSRQHAVDPSSNRLLGMSSPASTFSHDTAGNIINSLQGSSAWTATVDLSGRVSRLQASSAAGSFDVSYGHDNNGQRLWKRPAVAGPVADDLGPATAPRQYCGTRTGALGLVTVCSMGSNTLPASGVVFVHDQQGHLLGEYDGASGAALREYIWLGDLPVAVVDGSASAPQIYYVQTDHLDTPRVLLDRAGRQRWSWVAEPFGNSAPEENPIGAGTVSLNLRMPGQYFDVESGLSYNWHRSYDAGVGRYTQSDPIGLAGGINTYSYVDGNPVNMIDPYGLFGWADMPSVPQGVVDFGAGMGDVILFGQGQRLRDLFDIGGVDRCSDEYSAGEWAGVAASAATGVAGGIKAAGAKGAGREFSHWIPDRMGGPRSVFNGNFVSNWRHYKHDPYRYSKVKGEWRNWGPKWPAPVQQFDRIPNIYKGAAAGSAWGAAGMNMDDCTCRR